MNKFSQQLKQKGFTLVEVVIVMIVALSVLAVVGFRINAAISSLGVEALASELALRVYETKDKAVTGALNANERTFNLAETLTQQYNGIEISTKPILGENCIGDCSTNEKTEQNSQTNSICVSGNLFCFSSSQAFTFKRFSGRLASNHAIFLKSENRTMALLITTNGDHYTAELINGIWKTERDAENLFPTPSISNSNSK